ncbi:response regulator [Litoribacillus peritrichatus]|uniref:Response regulatory domain-containing protein n=1 Tax=Litoribacillus peritrichatus TaxID=718191 RepID=A0ABP7MK48_9GAMM
MYRIMIVDDEEQILRALGRILKRNGEWEFETYSRPDDALKRIQTTPFDLILSDYRMPGMNGVEFLTEVKKFQPDSARLILSGQADLGGLLGAINEAEIFRFIDKPWDDYDLITTMKQALVHRDMVLTNRMLADQVRQQQASIDLQRKELERLEASSPGLTKVNWGPNGEIILEE